MPFEKSLDQLVWHSGKSPTCAGSRLGETWYIEQGQPLKRDNEPVDSCTDWLIADTSPVPSLKVVVIRTKIVTVATQESATEEHANQLERLFEAAKLPIAGLAAYLKNLAQYGCIPSSASGAYSFFFSDPALGWTWAYSPEMRTTRAILLCRDTEPNDLLNYCQRFLATHKEFVDQPLLLSFLCIEAMGSRACRLIADQIIPEVLEIERSTGLETWNPATEERLTTIPCPIDESSSSRVIYCSQQVTDIHFRLSVLLEYCSVSRRQNQRHADFLRALPETLSTRETQARTSRLDEVIESFQDYLKVRKLKIEFLASRLSTQDMAVEKVQAIRRERESQAIMADSHRIAEDTNLRAKESTRDSKDMMTIAAVTMTFLPGTFVAAFFAMPIFQWDAPSSREIVNPRIWIYWALTVPLTFVVLGMWALYRFLTSPKEENENEKDT